MQNVGFSVLGSGFPVLDFIHRGGNKSFLPSVGRLANLRRFLSQIPLIIIVKVWVFVQLEATSPEKKRYFIHIRILNNLRDLRTKSAIISENPKFFAFRLSLFAIFFNSPVHQFTS